MDGNTKLLKRVTEADETHIPDGLIATNEPSSVAIAVGMWIVSIAFLAWSWKKAETTYNRSITALLAISSAFVFAAQMITFPIAFGTSGHLVGGTFLVVLLGPYAAMLSMTARKSTSAEKPQSSRIAYHLTFRVAFTRKPQQRLHCCALGDYSPPYIKAETQVDPL
jgi:hypothetical protein